MHHKAPGPKRIVHALRHAVAAHHHLVAVGHLFGCIHGNGAPGRKVRHALRIMDERPQRSHPHALLQQAVGELYRTVHSEAEARRLCLNDLHITAPWKRAPQAAHFLFYTFISIAGFPPAAFPALPPATPCIRAGGRRCAARPASIFPRGSACRTLRCSGRTPAFFRLCR